MPEYITKNEPVDNKPFIVYSGEKDADISCGGTAGGGIFVISKDFETSTLNATYNDITNAVKNGALPLLVQGGEQDNVYMGAVQYFSFAEYDSESENQQYVVEMFTVSQGPGGSQQVSIVEYAASSPDASLVQR